MNASKFPANEIRATQLNADSYGQMGYYCSAKELNIYIKLHRAECNTHMRDIEKLHLN